MSYKLMWKDVHVLSFTTNWKINIVNANYLPVWLQNSNGTFATQFCEWLKNRAFQLDRKFMDRILSAYGLSRSEEAKFTMLLNMHALSLTDNYWVQSEKDDIRYSSINLYENSFSRSMASIALTGQTKQLSISSDTPELTNRGTLAKCWNRTSDGIFLYKAMPEKEASAEIIASKIAALMHPMLKVVDYDELPESRGVIGTRCKLATSLGTSWMPTELLILGGKTMKYVLTLATRISKESFLQYHCMNVFDFITGNADRHYENWSFTYSEPSVLTGLAPLYDFNQCFSPNKLICKHTSEPLSETAKKSLSALTSANMFINFKAIEKYVSDCDNTIKEFVVSRIDFLRRGN